MHQDMMLLIGRMRFADELQRAIQLWQNVLICSVTETDLLVHEGKASLPIVFRVNLPETILQIDIVRQIEDVRDVCSNRHFLVIL